MDDKFLHLYLVYNAFHKYYNKFKFRKWNYL